MYKTWHKRNTLLEAVALTRMRAMSAVKVNVAALLVSSHFHATIPVFQDEKCQLIGKVVSVVIS